MKKKEPLRFLLFLAAALVFAALCFHFLSGFETHISAAAEKAAGGDAAHLTAVAIGRTLGILSLLPAILTVFLAFVTKEVLFSLFTGVVSGLVILEGMGGSGDFLARLSAVFNALCKLFLDTASDSFKVAIIILCLAIGGMVELISVDGGFTALGRKLTRNVHSARGAQMTAGLLGVLIFFDDYASALITGPVMRDITDRRGVSREKLAFIVDSTAAPVAAVAVVSSWLAAQLAAVQSGFDTAGIQTSSYENFIAALPYCFYNYLAVAFIFITAAWGREYGPMLAAERRARAGKPVKGASDYPLPEVAAAPRSSCIWTALVPVFVLVLYAFIGFYRNGFENAVAAGALSAGTRFSFSVLSVAFSYADAVTVLLRASLLASLAAVVMSCATGLRSISEAVGDWLRGASVILPTVVMLVCAWALSSVLGELGAAYYLVDAVSAALPAWLLPMLIFIICCIISFASGSFGCMVVVMPIAVPVALRAATNGGVSGGFLAACIGAVLSGSVFGDHSSPVTDTTILSSLGSGCANADHVETQLPYALTAAGISAVLGYLPAGLGLPPALSLIACAAAGILIVRFAGKKVETGSQKLPEPQLSALSGGEN